MLKKEVTQCTCTTMDLALALCILQNVVPQNGTVELSNGHQDVHCRTHHIAVLIHLHENTRTVLNYTMCSINSHEVIKNQGRQRSNREFHVHVCVCVWMLSSAFSSHRLLVYVCTHVHYVTVLQGNSSLDLLGVVMQHDDTKELYTESSL